MHNTSGNIETYDALKREWLGGAGHIAAHTSGSTGTPKEILLPRALVHDSALRTIAHFGIDRSWHLHSCISPAFIGGKMVLVRALEAGCGFSWETPSNRPELSGIPVDCKPCMVSVVPSQMWHIVSNPRKFSRLKNALFLVGGSAIPAELTKAIAEGGWTAYESYGMTETASHIAVRRIELQETGFTPLPGINVSLSAEGCLQITDGKDLNLVTNDLAEIGNGGAFRILGRLDNVIISGGRKIIPEEVERRLAPAMNRMGLGNYYITSRSDAFWGEKAVLVVELPEGETPGKTREPSLESLSLESLDVPHWMLPKEVICVEKLPRTPNGKTLRLKPE